MVATQAVINTYDGWYAPFFFTEEDREPSRNVPRSMVLGTLSIIDAKVSLYLGGLLAMSDLIYRCTNRMAPGK